MIWHTEVRRLMTADPLSIDVNDPPSRVRSIFLDHAFHHLPVLDKGVLVGIVSAVDIARVSLSAWIPDADTEEAWLDAQFQVKDLMTWEPEFVRADDDVRTAADRLSDGSFHSLPVLDREDKLVGIITSTDLLRLLAVS